MKQVSGTASAPASLTSRLVLTGMTATGLALLLVVLLLTVFEYWRIRHTMLQDSRVEAAIVADNVSASLIFNDDRAAREMLQALQASPMVMAAGVYRVNGALFAAFQRDGQPPLPVSLPSETLTGPLEQSDFGELRLIHPIGPQHQPGGWVYLRKSMQEVYTRLAVHFFGALLIALGAMGLASLLVLRSRAAVRDAENRLDVLAHTDPVTRVGNRHAFNERLAAHIAHARQTGSSVALVLIDLDNFKTMNDTHGHAAGDALLLQVAQRLQTVMRGGDVICRMGGDEFAIILAGRFDEPLLERYGQRIIATFESPFSDARQSLQVTGSAGIATFPQDAQDFDSLVRHADTAMYRAKELGKNRCQRFDPAMNQALLRRLAVEKELRKALHGGEGLALHYQPVFSAQGRSMVGAEALLRWTCPVLGVVPPLEAVSVAEDKGLIEALGYWVLRTACTDAARWQHTAPLGVAVNVSARQLHDPRFLATVMDILRETGLTPRRLEIELTETVLMDNMDASAHILHRLGQLGVQLAIDDFGTGYSSLAYLRQLPMKRIKIDRSFVRDLPQQEHSRTIVTAIIHLAHGLGLAVTAEGVETLEQADYLTQQGCDVLQGYAFARPMPAHQLEAERQQEFHSPT